MKRLVFIFFLFFASLIARAQTSEIISQLTPVPAGTKKVSKMLPEPKNSLVKVEGKLIFEIKVESVTLADGKKAAAVIIQTTYDEIVFDIRGEKIDASIDVYARIRSKDKKIDGFFEDKLTVTLDDIKPLESAGKTPVTVRRVFKLPAGKYEIGVVVQNWNSGLRGVKFVKFQISDSGMVILSSE